MNFTKLRLPQAAEVLWQGGSRLDLHASSMLQVEKELLQVQTAKEVVHLRVLELKYYDDQIGSIQTVATLLAGFAFTGAHQRTNAPTSAPMHQCTPLHQYTLKRHCTNPCTNAPGFLSMGSGVNTDLDIYSLELRRPTGDYLCGKQGRYGRPAPLQVADSPERGAAWGKLWL